MSLSDLEAALVAKVAKELAKTIATKRIVGDSAHSIDEFRQPLRTQRGRPIGIAPPPPRAFQQSSGGGGGGKRQRESPKGHCRRQRARHNGAATFKRGRGSHLTAVEQHTTTADTTIDPYAIRGVPDIAYSGNSSVRAFCPGCRAAVASVVFSGCYHLVYCAECYSQLAREYWTRRSEPNRLVGFIDDQELGCRGVSGFECPECVRNGLTDCVRSGTFVKDFHKTGHPDTWKRRIAGITIVESFTGCHTPWTTIATLHLNDLRRSNYRRQLQMQLLIRGHDGDPPMYAFDPLIHSYIMFAKHPITGAILFDD